MYPAIKQALDALRATLAEASGFDPSTSQRRFRISIPHPMGPFYALDLLKAAAAIAPGVVLTFDTVSRPVDLEDNPRDGIVDIAIDWQPAMLPRTGTVGRRSRSGSLMHKHSSCNRIEIELGSIFAKAWLNAKIWEGASRGRVHSRASSIAGQDGAW